MSETARIADQLRRAHAGEAWHGPSLQELLTNVSAEEAAARPVDGVHTIWEIVLHVICWERVSRRRMNGELIVDVDAAEDWPPVPESGGTVSEGAWHEAKVELEQESSRLLGAISEFEEERLSEQVPGKTDTFYKLLHGVIQHDLYHAGQIALLKKTVRESRPAEEEEK
jgi:uncharacterized damage-inducible protein DinB